MFGQEPVKLPAYATPIAEALQVLALEIEGLIRPQ